MELESGAYLLTLLQLYGHSYALNHIKDAYYLEYTQLAFRYY